MIVVAIEVAIVAVVVVVAVVAAVVAAVVVVVVAGECERICFCGDTFLGDWFFGADF